MGKINMQQMGISGTAIEATVLDDKGRLWTFTADKWIHVTDLPDDPDEEGKKVNVEQMLSLGPETETAILDDKGRIWTFTAGKWVHVTDLPDDPDED